MPDAAARDTLAGRSIKDLTRWQNRAYLGFGDLDGIGPTPVLSVDLNNPTELVTEATLTSDELGRYVPGVDGKLYAAFHDPQEGIGNPENGAYALCPAFGEPWETVVVSPDPPDVPYMEHVMAMLVREDGIYLAGAGLYVDGPDNHWTIIRSTDDGASWTVVFDVDAASSSAYIPAVYDFADGTMVFVTDGGSGRYYGDGDTFTHDPDTILNFTPAGTARFVFGGKEFWLLPSGLVVENPNDPITDMAALHAAYVNVYVPPLGGGLAAAVYSALSDGGEHLYVLASNSRVYRYDQDGAVENLLLLEDTAVSVLPDEAHGKLWYGTSDSRLVSVEMP